MSSNKQISEMLKFLSAKETEAFLSELMAAVEKSKEVGNFNAIDNCIEDWEETVELLSIPGMRDKAWERYNELKSAGIIS